MTKAEIVAKVAEDVKVTKKVAEGAFQTIISCIEGALKKGEKTTIVGFGTFSVADRKARKGVCSRCSIKSSGQRKGSSQESSKEGTGQTEEEINSSEAGLRVRFLFLRNITK
ncbi:MAG: HU family DNA-binding protein [Proteobacteria bacterium]|nr:HU family DNA-binding protein [Pseudomonadota bacterium]